MLKRTLLVNKNKDGIIHDENQYLSLISDILEEGTFQNGRNGTVKTVFGSAMHFSLENNTLPILTTKKMAWKTCLRELLWFIKGQTDNSILTKQNVHIWDGNSSRDYLDSVGLTERSENDLGPIYGHQWRFFNAEYIDCHSDYNGKGVDQLQYIIDSLNDPQERFSRRLIMSAWNPCQIKEMALPPCHVLCQFNVHDNNKLSCSLYQRSGDVGLGVPFNIASYSFLTHLIARHCNLEACDFYYFIGNCHIYDDHLDILKEQIKRIPYEFPKIHINSTYDDINDYNEENFIVQDYNFYQILKMEMRK
jgi:thymidylate synthase